MDRNKQKLVTMKSKSLIALLLFGISMMSVAAQESSSPFIEMRMGPSFAKGSLFGLDSKASVMKCIGNSWMVGGTFKYAFLNSKAKDVTDFPLNSFSISTTRIGVGPVVRYNLPVQCGYQSLSFMAIVSVNNVGLSAWDERYEEEDAEGDVTHTFELESVDGSKIGNPFVLTLELMYTIDIVEGLSLGLSLGCDVTHYIKDSFRHKSVTLTSTEWDDFEKYYGNPTFNIFEETAAGRKMSSPVVFYFGVSFVLGGVYSRE